MSFLGELLSFALEEEKRREKEELEKKLMPIWLISYALAHYKGDEIIDFEAFMNETLKPSNRPTLKNKTGDQIIADFAPFVNADKMRGI